MRKTEEDIKEDIKSVIDNAVRVLLTPFLPNLAEVSPQRHAELHIADTQEWLAAFKAPMRSDWVGPRFQPSNQLQISNIIDALENLEEAALRARLKQALPDTENRLVAMIDKMREILAKGITQKTQKEEAYLAKLQEFADALQALMRDRFPTHRIEATTTYDQQNDAWQVLFWRESGNSVLPLPKQVALLWKGPENLYLYNTPVTSPEHLEQLLLEKTQAIFAEGSTFSEKA